MRQVRRKNWRELLDGCVGHDAAQYAAIQQMPMTEVLATDREVAGRGVSGATGSEEDEAVRSSLSLTRSC
jgi:hypothetical protein